MELGRYWDNPTTEYRTADHVLGDAHGRWCAICFEYVKPKNIQSHHICNQAVHASNGFGVSFLSDKHCHSGRRRERQCFERQWTQLNANWVVPVHDYCHTSWHTESTETATALGASLQGPQKDVRAIFFHNEGFLRSSSMIQFLQMRLDPQQILHRIHLILSMTGTTIDPCVLLPAGQRSFARHYRTVLDLSATKPLDATRYLGALAGFFYTHGASERGFWALSGAKDYRHCIVVRDERDEVEATRLRREIMGASQDANYSEAWARTATMNEYSLITIRNLWARNLLPQDPEQALRLLSGLDQPPLWGGRVSWWHLAVRLFFQAAIHVAVALERSALRANDLGRPVLWLLASDYILGLLGLRPPFSFDPLRPTALDRPSLRWPGRLLAELQIRYPDELQEGRMEELRKRSLAPIQAKILARLKLADLHANVPDERGNVGLISDLEGARNGVIA